MQIAIVTLFTACVSITPVLADSTDLSAFKCGQHSIKLGMTTDIIKQNCKQQPSFVSHHKRPALKQPEKGGLKEDIFEKWMYSSAGQPATHVLIKNDKVIRIFTHTTRAATNP